MEYVDQELHQGWEVTYAVSDPLGAGTTATATTTLSGQVSTDTIYQTREERRKALQFEFSNLLRTSLLNVARGMCDGEIAYEEHEGFCAD